MLPTSLPSEVVDGKPVVENLQKTSVDHGLADGESSTESHTGGDHGAMGVAYPAPGCGDAPTETLQSEDTQDHPGGFSISSWLSWGGTKLQDVVQTVYQSLDENDHQNDSPAEITTRRNPSNHSAPCTDSVAAAHEPLPSSVLSQDPYGGIPYTPEEPVQEENRDFFDFGHLQGIRSAKLLGFHHSAVDSGELRFCFNDKFQFIDGCWSGSRLISMNLCRLKFGKERRSVIIVKQTDCFYIHINEGNFLARAVARCGEFETLNFTSAAAKVKAQFFKLFCIVEILQDKLMSKRDVLFEQFVKALKEIARPSGDPVAYATSLHLLNQLSTQASSQDILFFIQRSSSVQTNLRQIAKELLACNDQLDGYSFIFEFAQTVRPKHLNLKAFVRQMFYSNVEQHRAILIEKFPASLQLTKTALTSLPPEKVLYVTESDIEVFDHLCSLTHYDTFLPFFEKEFKAFMIKLQSVQIHTNPCDVIPLISPVYGFLFKSFLETVTEICSLAENCSVEDMLKFENDEWKLQKNIQWPAQRCESVRPGRHDQMLFFRSLESEYLFTFELLKIFSPCQQSGKKRFSHELKVLGRANSMKKEESWKSKVARFTSKLPNAIKQAVTSSLGLSKSIMDLPDERLVWLYLVDATVNKVFCGRFGECLDLCNPLLEGFVSFVSQLPTDNHESFRVVGHSALKFISRTIPYFSIEGTSTTDVIILEHQMAFITKVATVMASDLSAFPSFRDLIDEFNRYWALRQLLSFEELECPEILFVQIMNVFNIFMSLVMDSLTKEVPASAIVGYFQFLNDFMEDFKDIDFLENWYVKVIKSDEDEATIDTSVLEKVANKLESRTQNCSYRVIDLQKFVEMYERDSVPPHYLIRVIDALLKLAHACLSNQPPTSSSPAEPDHLVRTGLMLEAIRRSFLYLKEQPDYVDFNSFFKESTQPFEQIVCNSSSLSDFKKRISIVKESFWYIRKMDEIGIERALELLVEKNNRLAHSIEELRKCYDLYLTKYNQYIVEASSESEEDARRFFLAQLHNELPDKQIHFKKWDNYFKTEKIAIILAILSSAWSLKMSKDVSVAGKFLKPHCIQILCVMLLLSVDCEGKGVHNQLAQVLTGQGKSVIVGLLSATLALTGHEVRVLCYSKYLSSRVQSDFDEFYDAFEVAEKIKYRTFEDMAFELLSCESYGIRKGLSKVVEERVRDHKSWHTLKPFLSATKMTNTVLLVDEVDVFFSTDFYGSTVGTVNPMSLSGIAEVQEKIWGMVKTGGKQGQGELLSCLQNFISRQAKSGNVPFKELERFRRTRGSFPLLITDPEGNVTVEQYTNMSLMNKHLSTMITIAIRVANGSEMDWFIKCFKLNEQGLVCCKSSKDGSIYLPSMSCSYYNVFNYFRLKKANFDHKGHANYGYLLLEDGEISYARLPDKFPLILGVSGTLTDLYEHEKEAIESRYRILTRSVLPSYFGESNLVFSAITNFTLVESELDWCSKIFTNLSAMIDAQRAVLIFFYSETVLNLFKQESASKFNRLNAYYRLNELTENTQRPDLDLGGDESSTSKGARFSVTLATRTMGRGVDYQSSVAVEKNGGVHVIQTFLSIDVKEEIQIKGRTARKDNKGSYELILCREHLKRGRILDQYDTTQHTYASLNSIRNKMMDQQGRDLEERIQRAENNHNITMQYYGF